MCEGEKGHFTSYVLNKGSVKGRVSEDKKGYAKCNSANV